MWQQIGDTIRDEFSDLPDAAQVTRIALRLVMAAALGGYSGTSGSRRGGRPDCGRTCWSPSGRPCSF